jgi:hypothetical protein
MAPQLPARLYLPVAKEGNSHQGLFFSYLTPNGGLRVAVNFPVLSCGRRNIWFSRLNNPVAVAGGERDDRAKEE